MSPSETTTSVVHHAAPTSLVALAAITLTSALGALAAAIAIAVPGGA